jgi:predicted glutamine amidotransferase
MKRRLRESLKDEFYNMVMGTTDSEHAFALFLNSLRVPFGEARCEDMRASIVETIALLNEWTRAAGVVEPSHYNFAVTDGESIVISRYCSAEGLAGNSLHISRGERFECLPGGLCDMHTVKPEQQATAVIVASERLTDDVDDWLDVPDNHTVTVSPDLNVRVEAIHL